jgi:hypothetical protein
MMSRCMSVFELADSRVLLARSLTRHDVSATGSRNLVYGNDTSLMVSCHGFIVHEL